MKIPSFQAEPGSAPQQTSGSCVSFLRICLKLCQYPAEVSSLLDCCAFFFPGLIQKDPGDRHRCCSEQETDRIIDRRSSTLSRIIPARIALTLANNDAAADWNPKNKPHRSPGMIFPTILCQAVAVNPPPNPCHTSIPKESPKAICGPIFGKNQAITARPKNGIRSWIVRNMTIGLCRLCLATCSCREQLRKLPAYHMDGRD